MDYVKLEAAKDKSYLITTENEWGDKILFGTAPTLAEALTKLHAYTLDPHHVAKVIMRLASTTDNNGNTSIRAIDSIRVIRELCDVGLKEAKEAFDTAKEEYLS